MAHVHWHGKVIRRWEVGNGTFYVETETGWVFRTGPRGGSARTVVRPGMEESARNHILERIRSYKEVSVDNPTTL